MTPLVSICIPVFRGGVQMARALESCVNQTYQNLEIIICDNASDDNTRDVALQYVNRDVRIKYFCNDSNIGCSENFLRSFQLATGEYIQPLAHDDWISRNYIEEAIRNFNLYPKVAAVWSKVITVHENDGRFFLKHVVALPKRRYSSDFFFKNAFRSQWGGSCFLALVRKNDLIDSFGPHAFPDPFYLKIYQKSYIVDSLAFLKILLKYDAVAVTDKSAYIKLSHRDNVGAKLNFDSRDSQVVLNHYQEVIRGFECLYASELKKFLFDLRVSLGALVLGTIATNRVREMLDAHRSSKTVALGAFFSRYSFVEKLGVAAELLPSLFFRALDLARRRLRMTQKEFLVKNYFLDLDNQFKV